MIKKLLLIIIAVVGMGTSAMARDTYIRDTSALPKSAQTVLANNFKTKVSLIKVDKEFGRISEYEVILKDGTEISFDRDGNWKNVEVSANETVPKVFILDSISKYVKKNQPNQRIIGIEKERTGYEVELSNGVEMKFNAQGEFIKYDK